MQLLLPAAAALWLATCAWLSHSIGNLFLDVSHRREIKALIFVALLPLVLIDEMIGSAQFDELCRDRAVMQVYPASHQGRQVYVSRLPPEPVSGLAVPVFSRRELYIDIETNQTVLSATTMRAEGGKLSRALMAPATREPLTFKGVCSPVDQRERSQPWRVVQRAGRPAAGVAALRATP